MKEKGDFCMDKSIIDKAGEIIAGQTMQPERETGECPHCVLILRDLDGYPIGSTKSPAKSYGIQWIAFCDGLESNATKRARECNLASVCFSSGTAPIHNITLTGKIEIITDPAIKKEMWYSGMSMYFPGGADDPNLCVLMFKTERYNLFVDDKGEVGTL